MCENNPAFRFIAVVPSLSCVPLFLTLLTLAHQASLSFPIPEFAQTHVHLVSDAIKSSHPLSPTSPPAFRLINWKSITLSLMPVYCTVCLSLENTECWKTALLRLSQKKILFHYRTNWFEESASNDARHHSQQNKALKLKKSVIHTEESF